MYANRTVHVRYIYGGSRQCAKAADPFVHMTMHTQQCSCSCALGCSCVKRHWICSSINIPDYTEYSCYEQTSAKAKYSSNRENVLQEVYTTMRLLQVLAPMRMHDRLLHTI